MSLKMYQRTIKQIADHYTIEIQTVTLISRKIAAHVYQTTIKQIIHKNQPHHGMYFLALLPTESS